MPDSVFYFIPSSSVCDKDQWSRDTLESSHIDTPGHVATHYLGLSQGIPTVSCTFPTN